MRIRNLMLAALFDERLVELRLPALKEFSRKSDYLNLSRFASPESIATRLREKGILP